MSKKIEEKFDLSNLTEVELAELAARANKIKEELHSKNFPENLAKVREYISNLGMNLQEVIEALTEKPVRKARGSGAGVQPPKGEVIFEYTVGETTYKKTGTKGKAKWVDKIKEALTHEEALKYAHGSEGKKFVDAIYA